MVKSILGKAKNQCKGLEVKHSRDTGRPVWLNGISKKENSRSCCQKAMVEALLREDSGFYSARDTKPLQSLHRV